MLDGNALHHGFDNAETHRDGRRKTLTADDDDSYRDNVDSNFCFHYSSNMFVEQGSGSHRYAHGGSPSSSAS